MFWWRAGPDVGSSYCDEQYAAHGAEIVADAGAVFGGAEMIVKVKEPQPQELALLREGQILFTYLHLAADKGLTEKLVATGCTAIAYETIEIHRRLPLLEPMSEIAGRMSAIVGSHHLAKHRGGRGCLLGGIQLMGGKLTCRPVADAQGLEFADPVGLLG